MLASLRIYMYLYGMRRSRPPINGEVIRDARLAKGLTQEEVQQECARRGTPVTNLSRMESGDLKWPHPRVLLVLAEVFGLKVRDFLADSNERVAA
jgi:transcriptional regulator with XRE-family HTH domain